MNPPGMRGKLSASFLGSAALLSIVGSFCLIASAVHAGVPDTLEYSIAAPPGIQSHAFLGRSVAVEGKYVVVGAPFDDIPNQDSGLVKIFDSQTGALLFIVPNPGPQEGDHFGVSVAISGTLVVVGAEGDRPGGATFAGSAYVYDLSSQTPTVPVATLNNPTPQAVDRFGFDVAISGTRVVVGTPFDNTGANAAGSAYLYDLSSGTPTVPVATLNNPSPGANDQFGNSVAISGTRLVIGAQFDRMGPPNSGSVYVYELSSGAPPLLVGNFHKPVPVANDAFGVSVAISGTLVVVGTIGDDTGASNGGSAYVFDLFSATPTVPVVTLNNPDPFTDDQFGIDVAISGTLVVVGADGDDPNALNAGSAYLYDLSGATPTVPVATLNDPGPSAGDDFGHAVSISGTRVVVGAPLDDPGTTDAGSAYIYELSSGTPTTPLATLNDPGPSVGDNFGHAVAISGTLVAAGAFLENTGAAFAGSVFVYDLAGGTPTVPVASIHKPNPAENDTFGFSVAISGTRLVVSNHTDDTGAPSAGSVYVYDLSSASPTVPAVILYNPSPSLLDSFGFDVAISGTLVVVGAIGDDTGANGAGSAYVYDLNMPSAPVATLNNPEPSASAQFGRAVAISGTRVVVGARGDDTGATDAGSAYVYDLSSATPTVPVAILRNPSPAAGDEFGYAVDISGTRVVVGARGDDTGASDAGSAYVYDLSSADPTVPVATLNNPTPAVQDFFGDAVAISGTRVVVGSQEDNLAGNRTGTAYVYDLGSATPTMPAASLGNPAPGFVDGFGFAVGIDGDRVVIGAPFDDSPREDQGSIYIYGGAARSLNISTRLNVGTGDRLMIAGFIVSGSAPKPVLVRALGPSLTAFGINDALLDPVLELRNSNSSIEINDNWGDSPRRPEFEGGPLQPSDSRESVVLQTVPAGNYTALLTGKNNTAGVGTLEVYDLDPAADAQLGNISTRGFVGTGNNVLIGGFILGGTSVNTQVALRGVGPSLAQFGLNPVLEDPTLELRDTNGALLVANDDWMSDPASAGMLSAAGLGLSNPKESGIFTSLPPGQFTAILAGKNGGIGIGLVEVYNLR